MIKIRPLILFLLMATLGCARTAPEKPLALTDPIKELIRLCDEEHNFSITAIPFDHIVWIYLPLEENFLHIKANPRGFSNSQESSMATTIKFLGGEYKDNNFHLTYDIVSSKGYAKSYGYSSEFSEEYKTKQRHILTTITRVFNDSENPPAFIGIIIADITAGLEARTIIHFQDLKRAYVDQSFHEEYAKRTISEQPIGNMEVIGDRTGANIKLSDMTWPQFLSKQMVHRVNFKYQQSAFPPSDDTRVELLTIAADTVAAYGFEGFTSIQLRDLGNNTTTETTRENLANYRSEPSSGRLIHIKFQ